VETHIKPKLRKPIRRQPMQF